ncbi:MULTISPECIES: helix-turn-helix domain-containing protein [Roseivirga]|uniref:HTH cro/C1-type domain-containing protein n=1 Tax=Roseivirga spongicola TaxID=333140 RepID=A0A150X922_9BACT|nr:MULTISPECIES: helix-turn-helix domain-containing protein [Roseivirga]KYG75186.1 hypothetical protein AWW68_10280 [Roseivirga spongicola]MBO6662027.1 helix-turn-helix domain-containing protein [Roseivirga sp.]MBO6762563.1 helix-turn-helix domain-containing protein [Roseivirga sp.]MBO6909384.1 helix-turn-helix domain-containing protein [Roseivirga sp.]WPZ12380.1 helix-turn-helix domain-containing protein [Roseivirga spongicola]
MNYNFIQEAIDKSGQSITSIADKIGINRNTLYNWIKEGEDLKKSKLIRIGQAINHDFTDVKRTIYNKNENELMMLDEAELLQKVQALSEQIQLLESKVTRLEVDIIRLKMYK